MTDRFVFDLAAMENRPPPAATPSAIVTPATRVVQFPLPAATPATSTMMFPLPATEHALAATRTMPCPAPATEHTSPPSLVIDELTAALSTAMPLPPRSPAQVCNFFPSHD